jgi:hypothetical protein
MVELKHSDMRKIENAFNNGGYVLNFSDKTFREYFEDELSIDIDVGKYKFMGSSKMNRLRAFCKIEDANIVSKTLRSLWDYGDAIDVSTTKDVKIKRELFTLIERLENDEATIKTDAIYQFVKDETLKELISAIERDIKADKPSAALDRLHTYCSKKFCHLLDKEKVDYNRGDPLNSHVGKYVKLLNTKQQMSDMTKQIIRNAISVFDKFNDVRNNKSLAHDNIIIQKSEARFIFDSVSAILRLVKTIDTKNFGE